MDDKITNLSTIILHLNDSFYIQMYDVYLSFAYYYE